MPAAFPASSPQWLPHSRRSRAWARPRRSASRRTGRRSTAAGSRSTRRSRPFRASPACRPPPRRRRARASPVREAARTPTAASAFEEVGGFDPGLRFYYSDTDLAIRLAAAGWQTALVPGAVCVHLGSATAGRGSRFSREYGGFGRAYMLRRYGVLRGRRLVRTLVTEAVVVAADVVRSRDFVSVGSRVRGWQAAARRPRLPIPAQLPDPSIGFAESLRMRWRGR